MGWRRTASLLPPISAVGSAADFHDVAFASKLFRQPFEVPDLQFDRPAAFDRLNLLQVL